MRKWTCTIKSMNDHQQENLFKKVLKPIMKCLKCFVNINIVHKDATICSSIERDAEALKPFLPSRIPNLSKYVYIINQTNIFVEIHITSCLYSLTCIVTRLSSICTSLETKSAPIVPLYWVLNFLCTYLVKSVVKDTKSATYHQINTIIWNGNQKGYWFNKDVFPTLNFKRS